MTAAEVAALQAALATEHAAVWGYGAVGAALSDPTRPTAAAAEAGHRRHRDLATALLRDGGAVPVAAAAAYELPGPVTDDTTAALLAATLEDGTAASWAYVLGQTDQLSLRRTGRDVLLDAAQRAADWRAAAGVDPATVALPGL